MNFVKFILTFIAIGYCSGSRAQTTEILSIDTVVGRIARQLVQYPQEKVHLQIDKPVYLPGDTLWFKAYLVHSSLHVPFYQSRYIYTELISPNDSIVVRVQIVPENGSYYGYLPLPDNLQDGNYILRAYTIYMAGNQPEYLFRRSITVSAHRKRKLVIFDNKQNYDVSFYPEGGYLLSGTFNRVAFKAMDTGGYGININVDIVNRSGEVVASDSVVHDGMGSVLFTPLEGDKYRARCVDRYGHAKMFDLPAVQTAAYGLRVDTRESDVRVSLLSASQTTDELVYLVAHVRGGVVYTRRWENKDKPFVFSSRFFPAGVIQFLLLDKDMQTLSERLAFSFNHTPVFCDFRTSLSHYSSREKITAELKFTDAAGHPLKGNFSVAVTDVGRVSADTCFHILSTLLLTSELKGYIDNPAFYFRSGDRTARMALDLLMMTHGWRRYDLSQVLKGAPQKPLRLPETNLSISGKTDTRSIFNTSDQHVVYIYGIDRNAGYWNMTSTDKEGNFSFDKLDFPQGSGFRLEAIQTKGRKTEGITIFPKEYPVAVGLNPRSKTDEESFSQASVDERQVLRKIGDNHFLLQTVNVKAPYWGSINYDEMLERQIASFKNIRDIIKSLDIKVSMLPGTNNYEVYYRGTRVVTFVDDYHSYGNELLSWLTLGDIRNVAFVKDVSREKVNDLLRGDIGWQQTVSNPADICEYFYGIQKNSSSIPVLNIKTNEYFDSRCFGWWTNLYRDPQQYSHNRKTIYPLGNQVPAEFYSPKYDTSTKKMSEDPDVRTTLYWQPVLVTNETGWASFSFYSSDTLVDYSVVIEGISEQGDIIHEVRKIK